MTIVEAIIQRLGAEVPALKLIDGAAQFAALEGKGPARDPAAYVFLADEDAAPNACAAGLHIQGLTHTIAVALAVADRRSKAGAEGAAAMENLVDQVKGVLVGWSPAPGFSGFNYRRGRIVRFLKPHVWFQVELSTDSQLRIPPLMRS